MARARGTDYLQSMRFHVFASPADSINPFGYKAITGQTDDGISIEAQAGFSAVTTPEITVEVVEYHEGHHIYTRKFPGRPSVSDVSFSRGVAMDDTDFYNWILQVIEGVTEGDIYRADLYIYHGDRSCLPGAVVPGQARGGPMRYSHPVLPPTRAYELKDAFPIRCKVSGDLDATSGDISIAELDVAYERVHIHKFEAPPPT